MTLKSDSEYKLKTALFPGSFNPFTIGHVDIVKRALDIFDNVIVAVGYNENKGYVQPRESSMNNAPSVNVEIESRISQIRRSLANNPRVRVAAYTGLTADYAKSVGACCLIRGLRSCSDFDYEKNIADTNLEELGIDTMFFPCRPKLAYISSSMVRELAHNGFDTSHLIGK